MNIEQYEYMLGPQSDAGVKVFLHSKEDVPEVRDLGFAVSPGTHALVGVRLNAVSIFPENVTCNVPYYVCITIFNNDVLIFLRENSKALYLIQIASLNTNMFK